MSATEPGEIYHFKPGDRPQGMGDWELVELLGVDDFGEIWKGRQPGQPDEIALLKFCMDRQAASALLRDTSHLFKVRRATRLHSGLVKLRDFFLGSDPPCLVYEHVEATTLAAYIEEHQRDGQRYDLWDSAGLVRELAELIAPCHEQEEPVIHGDLKPEHILVEFDAEGTPSLRIAGFGMGGLAPASHAWAKGQVSERSLPPYASPARIRGEKPDARDDVYALGVIWWQLLCCDLQMVPPEGRYWRQGLFSQGDSLPLTELLANCLDPNAGVRPNDAGFLAYQLRQLLGARDEGGFFSPGEEVLSAAMEMVTEPYEFPELPASNKKTIDEPLAGLGLFATVLPRIRSDGPRPGEEHCIDIGGGETMAFNWVPEGSFIMGSLSDERGRRKDENPVETAVTLGFWMARTPCTQKQWAAVMGTHPSLFRGEDLPVENVSWADCQEFLQMLPPLEGDWQYSLPSEAEWEHACRAGAIRVPYDDIDSMAWHKGNASGRPQPVGLKKPNVWGLHDMLGNVGEWCLDWYMPILLGGADPAGPDSGACRSYRGGSWYTPLSSCRAASRDKQDPEIASNDIGFRVVLVQAPP